MFDLDEIIEEAIEELQEKELNDIQIETAKKWCGRAIAAQILSKDEREITEYAHEAVEHAALSGNERVVYEIMRTLKSFGISL